MNRSEIIELLTRMRKDISNLSNIVLHLSQILETIYEDLEVIE